MSSYLSRECPAENTVGTEQSSFFDGRWDAHEKGWVIAGVTALVSLVISLVSIIKHSRNYYVPKQQRQIIRILWMPAVYGVVSFFSYRFFRSYTYYSVAVTAYESLVLAAFLILLLQYVGESSSEQKELLKQKEKSKIPIPFCCIRFRPSKPYFLHALKWSVLQYSIIRPLISIIEIICQAYDVLCPTHYSVHFAEVYLDAVDFVSISVALYGLIVFYALVKEQLRGRKPLAKFLCIKFVVMILFYQSFVFSVLQSHGVIKATEYWTATNVADGLSALCTCCEMVIFAACFMWAFNWSEYSQLRPTVGKGKPTSVFWALIDSFNYWDFVKEGGKGIKFLFDFIRNKPGTRSGSKKNKAQLDAMEKHASGIDEKGDYDREHNKVGLDFEQAFADVRESDEDETSDLEHNRLGGRRGLGGQQSDFAREHKPMTTGQDEFERLPLSATSPERSTFSKRDPHPFHPSGMAQAAFTPTSAPYSTHPYASAATSQAAPLRDDWRPYTPPPHAR
ncbi:OSTA/TMEM184 family protein [Sporobolomyces koalae]|uniref:OSTA/TMEM184 family protein n=1 Tax=Sporobolomyces koalae TaxID=500713 RepID=UPI0031703BDF